MKFDIIVPHYVPDTFSIDTFQTEHGGIANVREIHIANDFGFTKAANIGLAISTAPYVVLLNDDATPRTENWLEKMAECFGNNLAAVGPCCDNPRQGMQGDPAIRNSGLWKLTPVNIEPLGWGVSINFSFFCVMISREALLDVGYLDERFSPGGGEDDDWIYRAYLKGWRYGIQSNVLVSHEGQKSWPKLESLQQRSERAVRLLKEKYADLRVDENQERVGHH